MRRAAALTAALLLSALPGARADVSGQAHLSYENTEYGPISTTGFRQRYDLHLDRALSDAARFRLFIRAEDFEGNSDYGRGTFSTETRQLQPTGEFLLNLGNLHGTARKDYFDIRSRTGEPKSVRTIDRNMGQVTWDPDALPRLTVMGQRNVTTDDASRMDLTDDSAVAALNYSWRGLEVRGEERYSASNDPIAGYDRSSSTHVGDLAYSQSAFDGKLMLTGQASAQLMNFQQRSVEGKPTSVPTPVAIAHELYGIDETPNDDRDHPLAATASLNDGDLNTSSGISLGPDGASFQNFEVDLGAIGQLDEIRILVRDPAGNPLRNGGGPVTWDVYTSQDGQLWTAVTPSQSEFNGPLSLYSITFALTSTRWLKVVNFGVNLDPTFVTEVQGYYHTIIVPGGKREGTQETYNGVAGIAIHPFTRLTVAYNGAYNSLRQDLTSFSSSTSRDLQHLGIIQWDAYRNVSLRGQYLRDEIRTLNGSDDYNNAATAFIDYTPTKQLRVTGELGHQNQSFQGSTFEIDTKAIHVATYVIRSVNVNLDAGTQTQKFSIDESTAVRRFANLTSQMQLYPSLRMLLTATLQRTRSDSTDPATQLLGPERDERVASEFIWRPGRPLTVDARFGWTRSELLSGFTQRYHLEWYPFQDGTVSLGGSYDEDIDPATDRRARRMIFNPRWIMNRFVIFDVNYTSVSTAFASNTQKQRSLYATLTLTR